MSQPTRQQGITADALLRRKLGEPTWVVPGLLPTGLAICASQPKVGKSFLSLHLAVAVAAGRPFLGSLPVVQGTVLYLALEDHFRRLQSRLTTVLHGDAPPRRLHLHVEWPSLADGGLDRLDTWLDKHPGTKLKIAPAPDAVAAPLLAPGSAPEPPRRACRGSRRSAPLGHPGAPATGPCASL